MSRPTESHDSEQPDRPKETTVTPETDAASVRSTRRSLLGGLATVTTGSFLTTSATAAVDPAEVPMPTVEGPIDGQPQTGAVHDLESRGYVEEEYFVSGEARPLGPVNPYPEDERTFAMEPASYRTRMLVYRPRRRHDFNGTAIVEWPNVSAGRDVPVTWVNTFQYAMREGYAVAVVSAQKVGVDDSPDDQDLVSGNPDRYGDLHHPGDAYSYDIFAQAIRAVIEGGDARSPPGRGSDRGTSGRWWGRGRDARGRNRTRSRGRGRNSSGDANPDPLDGLSVRHTIATGMSQSAHYLRYYVNNLQADHGLVDGFMPTVTRYTPEEPEDLQDDIAPVMWLMSEDEANRVRREDSGLFRLWEVPGASHINYWLVRYAGAMDARDFGEDNPAWDLTAAGQYGQRTDAVYGECSRNYVPMRYAYRAALDQLHDWVRFGREPPRAPRIEREVADDGTVTIQCDEYGNALGGLRLPPIDVPLAQYDATSCFLYGQTNRLEDATLSELYDSNRDYLDALGDATRAAAHEGYMLRADARDLLGRARNADVGGS